MPPNATEEQRASVIDRIDSAVREYLDRVAPMPDLSEIEAELRQDLPPPLPPTTPLIEVLDDVLREVEKALLGAEYEPLVAVRPEN